MATSQAFSVQVSAGIRAAPPFRFKPCDVCIKVTDIDLAYMNSLRIAVIDEVPGYAFDVTEHHFDPLSTECFALAPNVCMQIGQIPINRGLTKEALNAKYDLVIENNTSKSRKVTSADIHPQKKSGGAAAAVFWNTEIPLATVSPGQTFAFKNFRIKEGTGLLHAKYARAVQVSNIYADQGLAPADLPWLEQCSGFAESTFVSEPRSFELRYVAIAVCDEAEAVAIAEDACRSVQSQLGTLHKQLLDDYTSGGSIGIEAVLGPKGQTIVSMRLEGATQVMVCMLRMIGATTEHVTSARVDIDQNNNMVVATFDISGDRAKSFDVLAKALGHTLGVFDLLREKIRRSPVGQFVPLKDYT